MKKMMIVALILFIVLFSSINGCLQKDNNTIYVGSSDADYRTIKEAIDAAKNGATIIVKKGLYNELINISKTITLIGEDKNTTILNFNPDYDISTTVPIITINADNCSIENLQITITNKSHFIDVQIEEGGCCGEPDVEHTKLFIPQGISINSNYNTIKNNIITNVSEAIKLLPNSISNRIQQNQICNNQIGIEILDSENNTITSNIFQQNQQQHLYLSTNSDSNTISNNTMNNSTYGIRIKGSQYNIVCNNWITHTDIGMYFCCDAYSNYFYSNALSHNYQHAHEDFGLQNIWINNITNTGNYWEGYTGRDENQDGIGDTPYVINDSGNQDIYPLMNPPPDILCI